ncbi:uncharacterized protein LOC109810161 [Cajanus cajan]|uniref:uncharacterized protein LOC109810161 n=1 Tax=Cajanus cajan TaxID=3821 RepID=UPI00098DBCF8|nr:uncharacterized protein LOC109810161 [Cajanus cajan]
MPGLRGSVIWRDVSPEEVIQVHILIERGLRRYLTKEEIVQKLRDEDEIDPELTKIVWAKLEEENEGYFQGYYATLSSLEQERQSRGSTASTSLPNGSASRPNSNGSSATSNGSSATSNGSHNLPASSQPHSNNIPRNP